MLKQKLKKFTKAILCAMMLVTGFVMNPLNINANDASTYASAIQSWSETKTYSINLDEGGYIRLNVTLNFVKDQVTTGMTIGSVTCSLGNSSTTRCKITSIAQKGSTHTDLATTSYIMMDVNLETTCNGKNYKSVYRIEYQYNRLVQRYLLSGPTQY